MNEVYLLTITERRRRPTPTQPNRIIVGEAYPRMVALTVEEARRWIREHIEDHMQSRMVQEGREPRIVLDLDRPEPRGAVIEVDHSGFDIDARPINVTGGSYDHTVRKRSGKEQVA